PWIAHDVGGSWNYPVHYFDAAPALVRTYPDGVQRWMERWVEAHAEPGTLAWDPYPTALRIVNWVDVVARLGASARPAWRGRILQSIWQQSDWLARNLETHLLGTHLLKDTKALAIASTVFDDHKAKAWGALAQRILTRELERQVRADGGHVEPSL